MFQELEEVPMTMVGGFDVHRKQITFDYVDDDGLVRVGEIRPATRTTLRHWLREDCPAGDAELALEGCTAWRYGVDEPAAAGESALRAGTGGGIVSTSWPRRGWWRIWGIRPRSRRCGVRRSAPRLTGLMRGYCALCCWRAGFRSRGSRRLMWWRCAPWAGCTAR